MLAGLINIEFEIITGMVSTQYKGKDDLIEPNIRALEIGRNYALKYLDAPIRFQVERSTKLATKFLLKVMKQPVWELYMEGRRSVRGIPSLLRLQLLRLLKSTPISCALILKLEIKISPSYRWKMSWPR